MKEIGKTAIFVVLAVVLGGAAYFTKPGRPTLERFSDQGEPFYPEFTDPLKAASLEVIEFDGESGIAKPFKVEVKEGIWSIPSHHDYPADGKDRLAKTAGGVIDLRKDVIRSDRPQDHEVFGVIDPLDDTTPTLKGRGNRVTLRDETGSTLADFIIGNEVEGKPGFRYVRIPDKNRTYEVKTDADISTRFADWIETNLLELTTADIKSVRINNYSVDESSGTLDVVDNFRLEKEAGNKWAMPGLPAGKKLEESKVNQMASALSGITITGVRKKPDWLSHNLAQKEGLKINPFGRIELQSKGFFVSRDGRLLSNEGEVTVGTELGVRYTLRFGEVIFGDGLDVTAGAEEEPASADKPADEEKKPQSEAENRYLFVTADFDKSLLPPKPTPPEDYQPTGGTEEMSTEPEDEQQAKAKSKAKEYERKLKEWDDKAAEGRKLADELNDRFASWYYVISAADFKNIRLDREKLIKQVAESDAD
ncbi:MAG: DUF4340 domain-containing protein [Phycisphaerae bacterium]|nr:DUF4340 domain-containing protein [Phycisphaerae bacterium]